MEHDYTYLDCYTGTVVGDMLYVVNVTFGMLMEYDLKGFTYRALAPINLPDPIQPVRVNSIIKKENCIYMSMYNSWNVFEHDLINGQTKVYGDDFSYIDGVELVRKSILYGDKLWMIPREITQAIQIFNVRTKEFETSISIGECLIKKGYKIEADYVIYHIFCEGKMLKAAICNSPYIVEVNMELCLCKIHEVDNGKKIALMSFGQGRYWLSFMGSNVLAEWHPEKGILEEYVPAAINAQADWTYQYIYVNEDKIIAIPVQNQVICVIDKRNRKISSINYPEDFARVHNLARWMFMDGVTYTEKLVLLPYSVNKFVVIDICYEEVESYSCKLDNEEVEKYFLIPRLRKNLANLVINEDILRLSTYIDFIEKEDIDLHNASHNAGKQIWEQLK